MDSRLKVAYLPQSKGSWIDDRVRQAVAGSIAALEAQGVEVLAPDHVLIDEHDAAAVAREFRAAGAELSVLHFISFAPGAIVPAVANELDTPFVLWSTPEPPFDGGRMKANSFCAVNMTAHHLTKLGRKYFWVHGWPDTVGEQLESVFKVAACRQTLHGFRAGVIGGRVPGFYTSNFDELEIRKRFGSEVVRLDLAELFYLADHAEPSAVTARAQRLRAQAGAGVRMSDEEVNKTAALAMAHEALAEKYQLHGLALRCWPEASDIYGVAPCAAMGHVASGGLYVACEGDLQGLLTMVMARELSGGMAFFADLITIESEDGDNVGIAWHCGAACPDLAADPSVVHLSRHSVVDGGDKKGATWDFPVKGGPVTLAQLTTATGQMALFATEGEGLDRTIPVRGTPLPIRFDEPLRELATKIVETGLQHHYAVAPARITGRLKMLAKLLDLQWL